MITKRITEADKALDKRYPNAIENVEWWWGDHSVLDISVTFKEEAIDNIPEKDFDDWDGLDARMSVTLDVDLGR